MTPWAIIFLGVAAVAGAFAYAGIAGATAGVAQVLFFTFLALAVGAIVVKAVGSWL